MDVPIHQAVVNYGDYPRLVVIRLSDASEPRIELINASFLINHHLQPLVEHFLVRLYFTYSKIGDTINSCNNLH